MRTRRIASVSLAACLAAGPALASIDEVKSCTIWGGNHLFLSRGLSTDVTVTGFGVDLATSVTTTLPGTPLTVVSRKNGFGSNIVLRFSPAAAGNAVDGTVTLNYFGGGSDVFEASLAASPSVTSVAFAPERGVSTSGGVTRITSLDPHVLVLKGTNLNGVYLNDAGFASSQLHDARIVLQLPGELRISFTSAAGERSVNDGLLVVPVPCPSLPPPFSIAFTVFDPPRTPTPTPTATPTRTPTPLPFHPIAPPGGIRPFPTPTPTPRFAPLLPPGR